MFTIERQVSTTYEINKSTFITNLIPVTSVSDAKEFFSKIKKKYSDATHNITCYIIGKTGEYGHYNDDGEPSGTAGLPVLDVFKKNNVTNFACVVTRYFGGIKLGAGGLVRSYSTSASLALKEAGLCEIIDYSNVLLTFDYSYLDIIENKLKEFSIMEKSFSTDVSILVKIPTNKLDYVIVLLKNLTNNLVRISIENKE